MKKLYPMFLLAALASIFLFSCNNDDDSGPEYEPVTPVVLDLTLVPYPKLSDYHFFEGDMINQIPSYKVLPYKPASELFTDYAHKKRFVWMPTGTHATYNGASSALEFPVGAVLIKTFYYENMQPSGTQKILETRLLIKKSEAVPGDSGWQPYNYIWNEEQTEAFLDETGNGANVPIEFMENGVSHQTTYRIPATQQCKTCHKLNPDQSLNNDLTVPIGPKPQNLNIVFNYGNFQKNQLEQWTEEGYLQGTPPANMLSAVDWKDSSKPLEMRVRSYLDINCAHCHRVGGHCDYTEMRFNLDSPTIGDLGVCAFPSFPVAENFDRIIKPGDAAGSSLVYRLNSIDDSEMMPIMGRTVVHQEAVALITQWINSLPEGCD